MPSILSSLRKVYARDAEIYDRKTAIFRWIFGVEHERRKLIAKATGTVLDLPTGTGLNIPHFDASLNVTAADLSPEMLALAKRRAEKLGMNVTFAEVNVEDLPFDDNQFDTVVSCLGLCAYPDPKRAIQKLARVCSGKLLFLDHGLSSWKLIARRQRKSNEKHLKKHACHLTREPLKLIEEAGLTIESTHQRAFGMVTSITARK